MFIGQITVSKRGRTYTYHRLMESVRTPVGPRQRLILSLGTLSLPRSEWPLLVQRVGDFLKGQQDIGLDSHLDGMAQQFAEQIQHKRMRAQAHSAPRGRAKEVYLEHSQSEHVRELGPEYVANAFWRELAFDRSLKQLGFSEKQCRLAEVQVVGRLVAPRSELATASWYGRTALNELMANNLAAVSEDQLYRVSDKLYRRREQIQSQLAQREREIFSLDETIVLYDLSSTYFEGVAAGNQKARYGYSRDHRSDQKQVVVGLVLDGEGFPKAHEVFSGNTTDRHTLGQMLDVLAQRVGAKAGTVVVDRGLSDEDNLTLIRERGHHYVVTTRQSERSKLFPQIDPAAYVPLQVDAQGEVTVSGQLRRHGDELYVLCHSTRRQQKDGAIRDRFRKRFEEDAEKLERRVASGRLKHPAKINQAIGRLRERHPKVGRLYEIQMRFGADMMASVHWAAKSQAAVTADELDGTYLMRTDRVDLEEAEIWKLYTTLWRVEQSFRYLKGNLGLRPVFHQKAHRVDAHIFISLLAYHLLHAIERRLQEHGDHRSWPTIRDTLSTHQMLTIIHQCTDGSAFRLRRPSTAEQAHRRIYQACGLPTPSTSRSLQL